MSRIVRLRRAGQDQSGSTLVEFALLAPVLILLLTGALELGRVVLIKLSPETGVAMAARAARVDLKTDEDVRDEKLRAAITDHMTPFTTYPGRQMNIETKVYQTFGASYPESYLDLNGNGSYDGPSGSNPGEPFDDRNRNGIKDQAVQESGKLGGPGDVVSYRVEYPIRMMFGKLAVPWLGSDSMVLTTDIVLRNEPVRGSRMTAD